MFGISTGAEDRARTGHPDLGKVVLYQMSYFRDKELFFLWDGKDKDSLLSAKFLRSFFSYLYLGVYCVLSCTCTLGLPL